MPEPVPGGASDFRTPGAADWAAEVVRALNRDRPGRAELAFGEALAALTSTTVDGLAIRPLYTRADAVPGQPWGQPIRGTPPSAGSPRPWDCCALHEDSDVAFSSSAVQADLAGGCTSLWLRCDADAIAPADLSDVLAGVDPTVTPVTVSSRTAQPAAAAALATYWRTARAGARGSARGSLGLDALGAAALTGESPDLVTQRAWVATALREWPAARALVVDVAPYDNAGAGDVDLLAFALATGVTYLRDLEAEGVPAAAAFGQLAFRVPVTTDQFLSIARLRALRRLWARVGEVSGVPAGRRGAVQWAVTSWRMLTRDAPWVNLLRSTVATLAAAVGGAESITVLPFDATLGLPTLASRRLARNISLVVADEAHLGRVTDPAGGSWYVERLTDQLARRAWARLGEIEAAGGMTVALASGRVAGWIEQTAGERAVRIADGRQPMTGVTTFRADAEQPPTVRQRPRPPVLGGLPQRRDSESFEAAGGDR